MFDGSLGQRHSGERRRRAVLGTIAAIVAIAIAAYMVEDRRRRESNRQVNAELAAEAAQSRQRNEIVKRVSHLRETCQSINKSNSVTIRGKAFIWDFNPHPERVPIAQRFLATYPDGYTTMLPESIRAGAADRTLTIFMLDPTPSPLGEFTAPKTDQPLGARGHVYTVEVCVVYWPDMVIAGAASLTGSWPDFPLVPLKDDGAPIVTEKGHFTDQYGSYANVVVEWIQTLPTASASEAPRG